MALHPLVPKRHFPEELPVTWDLPRQHPEENEDWYRDLVQHSQDLLCAHDLQGRFLSINPVPARLLGYTVEEMMQRPMREFAPPQYRSKFDDYLREIAVKGSASGLMSVLTKAGEERIWEYHNTLRTEGVSVPIVRGIAHDVTERVLAEERLREFERVVENLEEMIAVVNSDYRYVIVNRALLIHRGATEEQIVGQLVKDIVRPELFGIVKENLDECFQGKVVKFELECPHATLGQRNLAITYIPVEGAAGIDRVAAVMHDITERKRAAQDLRDSEARERTKAAEMQAVLDAVPVPVLISHDVDCKKITANQAGYELLRIPQGRNFSKSGGPEDQPPFQLLQDGKEIPPDLLPMQQCAATGNSIYGRHLTVVFEDGTTRETVVNVVPLLDATGVVRGAVGASIDLTDLRRTEHALRESEAQFRTVYERSPVGIALVDSATGRFLQTNSKFCEIAGRTEEQLRQLDVTAITHPDDVESSNKYLHQMSEETRNGFAMDKRYVRPDGSVRWIRILGVPMWKKGDTRRWHMALAEDITDSRLTEQSLRDSEERFRVALKNSSITVFNQDRDLRYTWIYNSTLPAEMREKLGKTPHELFGSVEGVKMMEVGRRVLDTGIGVHDEMQITVGSDKRYVDTTIEPAMDSTGAIIGITGASTDVTALREITEALREAKKKLTEEKLYLEKEINTELGFGEIVGESQALHNVMNHVGKVATSDATVLLLGETGTGKELVARAIHRLSGRAKNSFIKLNCAAIPSGLLESELFGNEKGAFTGAVSRKIGRLELADKGTLFLDEIGEIALELQPKLLRVLQDQEFERLGGTQTLKVDFRLIAATNRDLADLVREGEFRSDLYYRLNVFPVLVPPLRDRKEDIRLLVEHFVQKCALRMKKSITSIPKRTMDALINWNWPGNVRELENFIERSVILTQGSVLVSPLGEMEAAAVELDAADETLEATEREHIVRALRESHGQIGGIRGAAQRLGLKRTTLQSKLKHLGINPRAH